MAVIKTIKVVTEVVRAIIVALRVIDAKVVITMSIAANAATQVTEARAEIVEKAETVVSATNPANVALVQKMARKRASLVVKSLLLIRPSSGEGRNLDG
jgi:hypothetical protein